MNFYGESQPDCAALAAHIRTIVSSRRFTTNWPIYPFLMTGIENAPPPRSPASTKLFARHFEALGQVFMRSGTGTEDTYCLYTIGSKVPSHKHFDENNFVIYKKGFLALDTGTRGVSKDFNLRHYYAQTVAHNCVLIHMPEEPFAAYWGPQYPGPEGKFNCGGMNKTTGGKVAAFETNDQYTYIAGDATSCYDERKCRLALRQLVFIMPDWFVICDRVISMKPEFKKEWLLHTQNEPAGRRVEGAQFRADEGEGRLFCRTLYPKDAVLTKIGGPGKEFWANGRNWELNDTVKKQDEAQKKKTGQAFLLGNWRMEVSPGSPKTDDIFLHLIQVGDQTLKEMVSAQLIEEGDSVGVAFDAGAKSVRLCFGTSGGPSGRIRISVGRNVLVEKDLAQSVMPQTGVGIAPK